jgi:hypothetical protein
MPAKILYVTWNVCNGEAHNNPFIDHCDQCMPFWASYPTCPECKGRVNKSNPDRGKNLLWCPTCSIHLKA